MSVTSVTQSITGTGQASGATGKLAQDYQTFLTLLVAQVQNQDPLAPMESTEFVSQLAQLTQVEQSVQVNSQMESLRQQLALNAALSETSLIGREVTLPSETLSLSETGGSFAYRLSDPTVLAKAEIRNSEGVLIHTIEGLQVSSDTMHSVNWNGTLADGSRAPLGNYTFKITATGSEGQATSYNGYSSGSVEAIEYDGGKAWLQLADGRRVQSVDIIRAR